MTAVTISTRINAERLMLLCWSRAILLQFAHPLVAAGVADHSSFRGGRLTPIVRLHGTLRAMLSLTFGSEAEKTATLKHINDIHRRVNGTLRQNVGPFTAGTPYSAEDSALLLWVHGTLLDSAFVVYERLIAPLSPAERDQYCVEAVPVARGLGVPTGEPHSWAELNGFMSSMYASGHITVGDQARELAAAVLAPPLSWMVAPAARVNRLITVGLLPPVVREQYGFRWNAADQRALDRWTWLLRSGRALLPNRLALWRDARSAVG